MKKTLQLQGETGRLDKVLVQVLTQESRSQIQKLIKNQQVLVEGRVEKANYVLSGHETIQVKLTDPDPIKIEPEALPLSIIYEDDHILLVDKAQGMVVHPSKGHRTGTLVHGLVHYLGDHLSAGSQTYRPGIVHRIDKDTSGLLVVAKTNTAHRHLAKQIHDHSLVRLYTALVYHPLASPEGLIDLPIGRDKKNRTQFAVNPAGKPARTRFKLIQNYQEAALVQAQLETGRTHQIRVHFEYMGHPIVGDPVYRKHSQASQSFLAYLDQGQYLHAGELHLIHPVTQEAMSFKAPLPAYFRQLIDRLAPLNWGFFFL